MSSNLSPSYLNALVSNYYIPYDARASNRDKNNSIFSLIKSRHISNSTHETIYCKKKTFDVSFNRTHPFWSHDMLGHYSSIQSIRLSPDERLLASGGEDGRLLVWDIQQALRSADLNCPRSGSTELVSMKAQGFYSVAFGARGDQIAGSGNGFLILSDTNTREVISNVRETQVRELAAHPSCEALFASASDRGNVYIWDRRMPRQCALEVVSSNTPFRGVQFHPLEPR
ncbi:WD40 domain-containing protein [Oopsacas minuta]|uniref:WD40 domain-containing protein n=1 Tax=Oopsacas minuta TaxID=111878 RepID=A0AAV7JRP2_9METZ|nr:WD40 domain-containing protein [Oopsacas minuta]